VEVVVVELESIRMAGSAAGSANTGGGGGAGVLHLEVQVVQVVVVVQVLVVVRAPSAVTFSVAPGTNSTATHPGGDKLATFTVSGTLTISK
jgi:hypothetical protein